MTAPDLALSTLVLAYLRTADSQAAGVPNDAACPLQIVDNGAEKPANTMIVSGVESGSGKAHTVMVMIKHSFMPGTASEDGQVTRTQSSTWLRAIDNRLRDHASWWAWLATQSAALRLGFEILHISHPAAADITRDENNEAEAAVAIAFDLVV
jgi:hypothetical protein